MAKEVIQPWPFVSQKTPAHRTCFRRFWCIHLLCGVSIHMLPVHDVCMLYNVCIAWSALFFTSLWGWNLFAFILCCWATNTCATQGSLAQRALISSHVRSWRWQVWLWCGRRWSSWSKDHTLHCHIPEGSQACCNPKQPCGWGLGVWFYCMKNVPLTSNCIHSICVKNSRLCMSSSMCHVLHSCRTCLGTLTWRSRAVL